VLLQRGLLHPRHQGACCRAGPSCSSHTPLRLTRSTPTGVPAPQRQLQSLVLLYTLATVSAGVAPHWLWSLKSMCSTLRGTATGGVTLSTRTTRLSDATLQTLPSRLRRLGSRPSLRIWTGCALALLREPCAGITCTHRVWGLSASGQLLPRPAPPASRSKSHQSLVGGRA